jgi:hypothetical protein
LNILPDVSMTKMMYSLSSAGARFLAHAAGPAENDQPARETKARAAQHCFLSIDALALDGLVDASRATYLDLDLMNCG